MADENKGKGKPKLVLPDDVGTFGALEWLTAEWHLPRGYRVVRVERTGGEEDDPISIVFEGLGEDQPRVTARFSAERRVRNGVSLRDGIASASAGAIRIPYFTGRDASEVFAALCLAAGEVTTADEIDEAESWIEATCANAEPVGASVTGLERQIETIRRLRRRRKFDATAARELLNFRLSDDGPAPQRAPLHPVRLIDPVDGHQYLRVDETYMYCRHLLGATNVSRTTFGSRLREVGVTRLMIGGRAGREVMRIALYLMPEIDLDWATANRSTEAADV